MFDQHEDLFSDETWRDPTDDWKRAVVYLMLLAIFFVGIGSCVLGFVEMARPGFTGTENLQASNNARFMFWIFGAVLICGPSAFFWKESKHWALRTMTIERFVSGVILATIAVVMMFATVVSEANMAVVFIPQVAAIVGVGILLTLIFGFAGAYFHKVFPNVARHDSVFVVEKVVAEDTRAKDAIFDVDDDPVRSRYVVLRSREFGEKRYRVLTDIYEVIEPGYVGRVKVVNGVIREFKVLRRPS
ncbi:MAG TPA: hypothetical protein VK171_03745 [Fimbriimonas sp.]|nr:hypothetical protein [Fimbriimonas sp.]